MLAAHCSSQQQEVGASSRFRLQGETPLPDAAVRHNSCSGEYQGPSQRRLARYSAYMHQCQTTKFEGVGDRRRTLGPTPTLGEIAPAIHLQRQKKQPRSQRPRRASVQFARICLRIAGHQRTKRETLQGSNFLADSRVIESSTR